MTQDRAASPRPAKARWRCGSCSAGGREERDRVQKSRVLPVVPSGHPAFPAVCRGFLHVAARRGFSRALVPCSAGGGSLCGHVCING